MRWQGHIVHVCASVCLLVFTSGCQFANKPTFPQHDGHYDFNAIATKVEYPDANRDCPPEAFGSLAPRTIDDGPPKQVWELNWTEVVGIALKNSQVLKNLGGTVLSTPSAAPSIYDPAIQDSNPVFGPDGALSAFDANLSTSIFWERNDQALNSVITGGGTRELSQELGTFDSRISKVAATGTQFNIRNLTTYDQNNQPSNLFQSGWDTQVELNVTHPFLRGGGVKYNRIAGPNAQAGFTTATSGVLIARINTDISLADFESGVRDFVSQLEDSYWDLYFAYRDLDSKILARDSALETWRITEAKFSKGLVPAQEEAEAREQYFLFQDQVQDALNGAPVGSQSVGVYVGERRLRRMMGLTANDGSLIRPAEEPSTASVEFDWDEALNEALTRRVELRRQLWQIKRRELELIASRNFIMPQLDGVAQYTFRGFGDHLTGSGPRSSSAFQDLGSSDHQEWQLGLQFGYQFGYRQGWAGIRQAKLQLARERAVLKEQEIAITHGLSDAIAELSRAHGAVRINYSRLRAATQRREATETRFQVAKPEQRQQMLNLLLQSQQRLADAQSRYFLSLSQYAKAVKEVHRQKGTLLPYNGIHLSEGPWPEKAYGDAKELRRRWRPTRIDYRTHHPPGIVSKGAFSQHMTDHGPVGPDSIILPGVVPHGVGPDTYEVLPPHDDDPSITDRSGKKWKTILPSFFLPKPTYRTSAGGNRKPILSLRSGLY